MIFALGLFSYSLEFSTTSNSYAAHEYLLRFIAFCNLLTIVFSLSTTLPYFGKIMEGNQAW